MIKSILKSASLVAAGTILATGLAVADPNRYPYIPDTDPLPTSKVQPLTGPMAGSIEEYPDTAPLKASKYQKISHEPLGRYDMDDRVDLVPPKPMHWR